MTYAISHAPPRRLADLVEAFAATQRMATTERYATRCAAVARSFLWRAGVAGPAHITPAAIQDYLTALHKDGRAAATVKHHAASLRRFCEFLVLQGFLVDNPATQLWLPKLEDRTPVWLTAAEVEQVQALARDLDCWPEVALALGTGLRLGELMRLSWGDIETERRTLLVRKSKNRKRRAIPLGKLAMAALAAQREKSGHFSIVFPGRHRPGGGQGWVCRDAVRGIQWWMATGEKFRAEIPKFAMAGKRTGRAWHTFRHSYASHLAQSGVSLYKLAQWLGHSDVKMTQQYAHLQSGYDPDIERAW